MKGAGRSPGLPLPHAEEGWGEGENSISRLFSFDRVASHGPLETWHPTCIAKLIREAEAYAWKLGFKPHADYAFTRKILDGLDPDLCPRTFTFGRDGKPFFISGPHDTPKDIK